MQELLSEAQSMIEKASHILVLSGAGLSTESGIPDFRSPNGLYSVNFHGYSPEVVLSHRFYQNQTDLFFEYLHTRLNYPGIIPDESYRLLADLESDGRIFAVLTQNIDSLHIKAGSKNVVELHGTLSSFYCDRCGKRHSAEEMMSESAKWSCECGGIIRPDVVLYDESVSRINEAMKLAQEADLLLVLGTSLQVYPVAHIPQILLNQGKPVIIINRDPTPYSRSRGVCEINAEIGSTLKKIFPSPVTRN